MNKKNILIIIGFVLAITLTATITVIIVKSKTQENPKENITETTDKNKENALDTDNNSEEKTEYDTVKDETEDTETSKNPNSGTSSKKEESTTTNKPETNKTDNPTVSKTEADVINYVEEVSTTSSSKALKDGFVKVIDFLFYDGKIYDKTFSELSNSAKIKIISLALKIDAKIDEYFPNYKETISNTTSKLYTNIKTKLVTLYLDTTVKICNNNKALCEDAKAGLQELKTSFGVTWDFIKDITGIGLTKLKDWYEVWR